MNVLPAVLVALVVLQARTRLLVEVVHSRTAEEQTVTAVVVVVVAVDVELVVEVLALAAGSLEVEVLARFRFVDHFQVDIERCRFQVDVHCSRFRLQGGLRSPSCVTIITIICYY